MSTWWLSSPRMTVCVTVDDENIIRNGPPIVRVFIGQPLVNLTRWMARHGAPFYSNQLD